MPEFGINGISLLELLSAIYGLKPGAGYYLKKNKCQI